MRRCKHAYCSDCATRRGRNTGNRVERHNIRKELRNAKKSA